MKFLKENWYKLMTGTAMLIFACGFFIYAVGPSYASYNGSSPSNNDYALVPVNKDGSINVKMTGTVDAHCYYYNKYGTWSGMANN